MKLDDPEFVEFLVVMCFVFGWMIVVILFLVLTRGKRKR